VKRDIGIGTIVIIGLVLWWLTQRQEAQAVELLPSASGYKALPAGLIVGGTPDSCGYQYYPDRGGWMRSWDESSFIPASQKPEWSKFISEYERLHTYVPITAWTERLFGVYGE